MEGILEKTKTELLAALVAELEGWPGLETLEPARAERIQALDAAVRSCDLSIMEQYWRSLCGCWVTRASGRPDEWLKEHWLLTLNAWADFVARSGIGADSRPDPRATEWWAPPELSPRGKMMRARKEQEARELDRLFLGALRPRF